MTKLTTLRAQLASLRRARALVRGGTAWSTMVTAALWTLIGIFIFDVLFQFGTPERLVLMLVGAGIVAWAGHRFTRPLLGVKETDEDIALMVERQQQLDSDLVAALQFEKPEAAKWGSVQLETAVIDYVADVGRGINVFEGFNREQMIRRLTILGVTSAAMVLSAAIFPGYALAFANRIFLGGMHYPTRTQIAHILVNHREVLAAKTHGSRPEDAKCAQGRPITFLIQVQQRRGELPEKGRAQITSIGPSRAKTEVELKALSHEQRLTRLKQGEEKLRQAALNPETDISQPWRDEILSLVAFDAPRAVESIASATDAASLNTAAASVADVVKTWQNKSPGEVEPTAIYQGEMQRLADGVKYKLYLGDAWTDPARVAMIPLPIVERKLTPLPPAYARTAKDTQPTSAPQISVLEGSQVNVAVECKNEKSLSAAWLVTKVDGKAKRFELAKQDSAGKIWGLAVDSKEKNPFARIAEELKYEIQATDTDGLSLETPLRGVIRIRPDRSPSGAAKVVSKVVLPTAAPKVHYGATDDFGIAQLKLAVEVERQQGENSVAGTTGIDQSSTLPAQLVAAERVEVPILPQGKPLTSAKLPVAGEFKLELGKLPLSPKLAKGDRIKVVLEVVDYRGDQPGVSYYSDPLVLEISDESGVLAAISEGGDPLTDQRLSDIIKRQLGIGETP
jgi:hypothetical protein